MQTDVTAIPRYIGNPVYHPALVAMAVVRPYLWSERWEDDCLLEHSLGPLQPNCREGGASGEGQQVDAMVTTHQHPPKSH